MSIKCLFGHHWNTVNGECIEKCSTCGKERDIEHKWNGCKCERCGARGNEGHEWNGYKCERCGKIDEPLIINVYAPKLLKAVDMGYRTTVTEIGRELYELGGNSLRKAVARQIGELNASYLGSLGYFIQY